MSLVNVSRQIAQVHRLTAAEASHEQMCAEQLRRSSCNVGYVERRDREAARLRKAAELLEQALRALNP